MMSSVSQYYNFGENDRLVCNEADHAFFLMNDCEITDEQRPAFYKFYLSKCTLVPAPAPAPCSFSTFAEEVEEEEVKPVDSHHEKDETSSVVSTAVYTSDFSHETCAESDSERSSAEEMATTKLLACTPGVDLRYLAEVFLAAQGEGVYSARDLRDFVTKLLLNTTSIHSHDDFSEVLQHMFGTQLNENLRSQFIKSLDHCRGYSEEPAKKTRRGGGRNRARRGSSPSQSA